jgi:cholesterol transport system auxiliary component
MPANVRARNGAPALSGALIGVLALAVAGCTAVLPGQGEPPQLYTLSPKSTFSQDLPTLSWQLVVELPVSAKSLNTSRIALRHDPLSLEYYKSARWTERAPIMVQTLLVESFENTNRIVAVARKTTDLRADYVLKSDLREFQVEYDGRGVPVAHVRLNAKLVKMPQRTIIASRTAESEIPAEGADLGNVVAAFDEALGKVLKEIVEWSLKGLNWQSGSADGVSPDPAVIARAHTNGTTGNTF